MRARILFPRCQPATCRRIKVTYPLFLAHTTAVGGLTHLDLGASLSSFPFGQLRRLIIMGSCQLIPSPYGKLPSLGGSNCQWDETISHPRLATSCQVRCATMLSLASLQVKAQDCPPVLRTPLGLALSRSSFLGRSGRDAGQKQVICKDLLAQFRKTEHLCHWPNQRPETGIPVRACLLCIVFTNNRRSVSSDQFGFQFPEGQSRSVSNDWPHGPDVVCPIEGPISTSAREDSDCHSAKYNKRRYG